MNPSIGFDITFDKSDAPALKLIDDAIIKFLKDNAELVSNAVKALTTPPNLKEKALRQLQSALELLKLGQALETHEKNHTANAVDQGLNDVASKLALQVEGKNVGVDQNMLGEINGLIKTYPHIYK